MAFSKGSEHRLAIVEEVTFNTTPATPAFDIQRVTGCSLALSKSAIVSSELRPDRQVAGIRHGNRSVAGEIPFELSSGAQDVLLEAAMAGTWTTNVLKNGVTDKTFTIEQYFSDISKYIRHTGCAIGGFSLSVAPDAIVTGAFQVVGSDTSTSSTIITGATYNAAPTNDTFDSFGGTINEGGSAIATITAIELSLDNGIDPAFVVGSANAADLLAGFATVTGSVSAFFDDVTLLQKFISETETSIDFTLSKGGKSLTFDMPSVKYTGGDVPVQGPGGIIINMPFQAYLNSAASTTMTITRVP